MAGEQAAARAESQGGGRQKGSPIKNAGAESN